jgi:hypothetical protein
MTRWNRRLVAALDPDRDQASDMQYEWTFGMIWFINGHCNKITADYSWLAFDDPAQGTSQGRSRNGNCHLRRSPQSAKVDCLRDKFKMRTHIGAWDVCLPHSDALF